MEPTAARRRAQARLDLTTDLAVNATFCRLLSELRRKQGRNEEARALNERALALYARRASEVLADLRQLEVRRRRRVLVFERHAEMVVELEGTELLQEQRQLGILVGAAAQLDRETDARDSAGPAVGLEAAHHLGAGVRTAAALAAAAALTVAFCLAGDA